jgi:lysophospholipase L1-like esterase
VLDEQGMLKKELSDDGLHPNAKGYAVMQPLAEQAISAALKKKR